MTSRGMACCACVEIDGIEDTTPEDALIQLCEEYEDTWAHPSRLLKLPGHVIFTGCLREGQKEFTYVQDFADYLIKNKLGRVTLSHPAFNRVNHPDHKIVVGVWSPFQTAMAAWWKVNNPDKED